MAPLINLLKKDETWQLTPKCVKAFSKLKYVILLEPLIQLFNFDKPFILHTNVSSEVVGEVLNQEANLMTFMS